jgi:hypothetical protein
LASDRLLHGTACTTGSAVEGTCWSGSYTPSILASDWHALYWHRIGMQTGCKQTTMECSWGQHLEAPKRVGPGTGYRGSVLKLMACGTGLKYFWHSCWSMLWHSVLVGSCTACSLRWHDYIIMDVHSVMDVHGIQDVRSIKEVELLVITNK